VTKDAATGELTLHTAEGAHGPFDAVLMAVGRAPLTGPLDLGHAPGVALDGKARAREAGIQKK
jgi:pyruvate/2-oxoglutarate dehydrogenase complex dihydrolipoamide dehydrogenase (E3) component